jgi:tetratricopeptide (TPR) repeat protein
MAVIALSVSTALIWQEQARTADALTQAKDHYESSEAHRQRAEGNFQLAREAVDQMLTRVAEELKDRPHMERTRQALLEDALAFYQAFLEERSSDPAVRYETARAYRRVGGIYRLLASLDQAEEALRQAIAFHEELADAYPDSPEYRRELGACHRALGRLLNDTSRPDEAREHYHANLRLREALVRDFPAELEFRADLAYAHLDWAEDPDGPEQREHATRRALAIVEDLVRELPSEREYRSHLAFVQSRLGELLRRNNRPDEAEPLFRSAIALEEELLDEQPDDPQHQRRLAANQNLLGAIFLFSGRRPDEAEDYFRRALEVGRGLAANHPDVPIYRSELGAQLHNLGSLLHERGQFGEGAALLEQAIQHQSAAYELNPSNPQYAQFLRNHWLRLADTLIQMGNHADAAMAACRGPEVLPDDFYAHRHAVGALADCLRIAERDETLDAERRAAVMGEYADQARIYVRKAATLLADDNSRQHHDLAQHLIDRPELRDPVLAIQLAERAVELAWRQGECWNMLGMARYRAGDWTGAIEALNKSVELRDGGDASDWLFLAMSHWQLDNQDETRRWYRQAIRSMQEEKVQDEQLQRFHAEAAELLGVERETTEEQQEERPEENPG